MPFRTRCPFRKWCATTTPGIAKDPPGRAKRTVLDARHTEFLSRNRAALRPDSQPKTSGVADKAFRGRDEVGRPKMGRQLRVDPLDGQAVEPTVGQQSAQRGDRPRLPRA